MAIESFNTEQQKQPEQDAEHLNDIGEETKDAPVFAAAKIPEQPVPLEMTPEQEKVFKNNLTNPAYFSKIWDERLMPQGDIVSPFRLELEGFTPRQANLIIAHLLEIGALDAPEPLRDEQGNLNQDRPKFEKVNGAKPNYSLEYPIKTEFRGKTWAELTGAGKIIPAEPTPPSQSPGATMPAASATQKISFARRAGRFFGKLFKREPVLQLDQSALPRREPTVATPEAQPKVSFEQFRTANKERALAANQNQSEAAEDIHLEAALQFNGELFDLIKEIREKKIINPDAAYQFLKQKLETPQTREIIGRMNEGALDKILFNTMRDQGRDVSESARLAVAQYLRQDRKYLVTQSPQG